jgi:hypothetical protein
VLDSEIQKKNTSLYSSDEIQNISELGEVLKRVRARLKSEGISIDDARKKLWESA